MPASLVWVPDAPRIFNLGLRSRAVDASGRTVTLELASDEALLTDYVTLVEDDGARAHEGSVRGVVNYVLGKIGASLAPGGPDADVTAYWELDNLIGNPTFQIGISQWAARTAQTTLAWSSGGGFSGPECATLVASAAGNMGAHWGTSNGADFIQSAAPGDVFTASLYVRSNVDKTARLGLRFTDGTTFTDLEGASTPITYASWTRLKVTGTVPAGKRGVTFYVQSDGFASGQFMVIDAAMLTTGDELVPYFDGLTPDDAHYTYEAAGTPHASATTRTPVVERSPDLFVWKPGVTAWAFLQPFTTMTGLRLFCDELRVWRLIDPGTYEVPGLIAVSGFNATDGGDTISREDSDVFATGVVVLYADDAYDSAGTPEKGFVLDYTDRAYPGPGAAAAILARRNGTGHTQDVTALAYWPTTPGMEASVTLPGVNEQRGKVLSTTFSLGDDALMQVGTRDLIDTIPGSIDDLDGTIDGLVGTIDSL